MRVSLTKLQVFGNSNSLPISLVLSLSQTIKGLHWDKIPGDNDDEVGARGILYLLIFQQLGQLLRWSWGINVLLPKRHEETEDDEYTNSRMERGQDSRSDATAKACKPMMTDSAVVGNHNSSLVEGTFCEPVISNGQNNLSASSSRSDRVFESGEQTPVTNRQYTSSLASNASKHGTFRSTPTDGFLVTPANGNVMHSSSDENQKPLPIAEIRPGNDEGYPQQSGRSTCQPISSLKTLSLTPFERSSKIFKFSFEALPLLCRKVVIKVFAGFQLFGQVIWQSMNPPLFAMGIALIVASIPSLQRLFFSDGTFVKNSITSAIRQSGGVAVPLILVVLGANLARGSELAGSTTPSDDDHEIETKLLIASLIARMVLPTIFMAPLLAIAAKYIPVSILDDPIFVIVCFLLAGAPSALQLAQICQLNDVYMGAMTRILFHSYVIWFVSWSTNHSNLTHLLQDSSVNSYTGYVRSRGC